MSSEISSDIPDIFKALLEDPFSFPNINNDGKCISLCVTCALKLACGNHLLTVLKHFKHVVDIQCEDLINCMGC